MSKFIINGGKTLEGEIAVAGAKNAALKALAASVLLDGTAVLENVPNIEDIRRMVELMKSLGITITHDGNTISVDPSTLSSTHLNPQLHQKVRASFLLAGPVLVKKGEIDFPYPGGCIIGKRPIDFVLDGFRALGVSIDERDDGFRLRAEKLRGAKFVFPRVSVTGTEALIMLACRAPGTTTLINAAQEPEIPSLVEFLNSCGAKISGAGTSTITITGVDTLTGGTYRTMPDRLEAGTFAILAAATGSHVKVVDCNPGHLEVLWTLLRKAGVTFTIGDTWVEVFFGNPLSGIAKDIVTHEYPGLPTDLQPPLTVLMTQSAGASLVFETIYEGRLFYTDVLNSMGANILLCDPHRALVTGPTKLTGRKIASPDLRAGIALVIAALTAHGTTEIDNVYQIDRGYENIEGRLQKLGADIVRVES